MDQIYLIDALKALTDAEERRQDQLHFVAELTARGVDPGAAMALLDRMDETVHLLQLRLYALMSTDPTTDASPPPPPPPLAHQAGSQSRPR